MDFHMVRKGFWWSLNCENLFLKDLRCDNRSGQNRSKHFVDSTVPTLWDPLCDYFSVEISSFVCEFWTSAVYMSLVRKVIDVWLTKENQTFSSSGRWTFYVSLVIISSADKIRVICHFLFVINLSNQRERLFGAAIDKSINILIYRNYLKSHNAFILVSLARK